MTLVHFKHTSDNLICIITDYLESTKQSPCLGSQWLEVRGKLHPLFAKAIQAAEKELCHNLIHTKRFQPTPLARHLYPVFIKSIDVKADKVAQNCAANMRNAQQAEQRKKSELSKLQQQFLNIKTKISIYTYNRMYKHVIGMYTEIAKILCSVFKLHHTEGAIRLFQSAINDICNHLRKNSNLKEQFLLTMANQAIKETLDKRSLKMIMISSFIACEISSSENSSLFIELAAKQETASIIPLVLEDNIFSTEKIEKIIYQLSRKVAEILSNKEGISDAELSERKERLAIVVFLLTFLIKGASVPEVSSYCKNKVMIELIGVKSMLSLALEKKDLSSLIEKIVSTKFKGNQEVEQLLHLLLEDGEINCNGREILCEKLIKTKEYDSIIPLLDRGNISLKSVANISFSLARIPGTGSIIRRLLKMKDIGLENRIAVLRDLIYHQKIDCKDATEAIFSLFENKDIPDHIRAEYLVVKAGAEEVEMELMQQNFYPSQKLSPEEYQNYLCCIIFYLNQNLFESTACYREERIIPLLINDKNLDKDISIILFNLLQQGIEGCNLDFLKKRQVLANMMKILLEKAIIPHHLIEDMFKKIIIIEEMEFLLGLLLTYHAAHSTEEEHQNFLSINIYTLGFLEKKEPLASLLRSDPLLSEALLEQLEKAVASRPQQKFHFLPYSQSPASLRWHRT